MKLSRSCTWQWYLRKIEFFFYIIWLMKDKVRQNMKRACFTIIIKLTIFETINKKSVFLL
jgi:hypothetical protein